MSVTEIKVKNRNPRGGIPVGADGGGIGDPMGKENSIPEGDDGSGVRGAIGPGSAESEDWRMANQAGKMEMLGHLVGGVAHDFNNMLAVILGNVELALEQTPPSDGWRLELEEIRKAAERSVKLTRQLLGFVRMQERDSRPLDLNASVEGLLDMLRRLIGENIALDWRPGGGVGWVQMDPTHLDQILINLCVNARDAIGEQGRILIETSVVESPGSVAGRVPGGCGEYVRLVVSDDGCGMTPETQARLFEPFYTTKKAGQGTGLGLASVYGILKQNGGYIRVNSREGQGTTFEIHLPRQTVGKRPEIVGRGMA